MMVRKGGSPIPPTGVGRKSDVWMRLDRETAELIEDVRTRLKLPSRGEALRALLEVYQ